MPAASDELEVCLSYGVDLTLFTRSPASVQPFSCCAFSFPPSAWYSYGVKELLLDICKALLGDSVQLTDEVDLEKPSIDKVSEPTPGSPVWKPLLWSNH